jgi:hypothetical protein
MSGPSEVGIEVAAGFGVVIVGLIWLYRKTPGDDGRTSVRKGGARRTRRMHRANNGTRKA